MNRREFVALAAGAPLLAHSVGRRQPASTASQGPRTVAARSPQGPFVCMHQISSNGFDYRASLEGYAKAGVRAVEVVLTKAREFAEKESPAAARRLLDDLGLQAVSSSNQLGIVEPSPSRAKNLDDLKWKCELARTLGADKIVAVPAMTAKPSEGDYERGVENLRAAADVAGAFDVSLLFEFSRFFTLATSLTTALMFVRSANHPHVRLMIDTYHFWIGPSKSEDLDLVRDGELAHMHFEDTPREPVRELLEQRHRALPGDGVAPLRKIVDAVKKKSYAGPLSVELFDPSYQSMDPYQLAAKVRAAVEPLLA
jgi:sugar phosphate isomerase/epimerase